MNRFVIASLLALWAGWALSTSVSAMPTFKTAFEKKYVQTSNHDDFKNAFKKETCNVCHVKGKQKNKKTEHLNAYGKELEKLIEGNANERQQKAMADGGDAAKKKEADKILVELEKAFGEVEKLKSKSDQTYGELIKAGILPGATSAADENVTKR
jgi:hypothetical protein